MHKDIPIDEMISRIRTSQEIKAKEAEVLIKDLESLIEAIKTRLEADKS